MSLSGKKPQLYFIPHYVGGLRYFEKIMPYLSERYDVRFLLIYAKRGTFQEMVDYCKAQSLRFYAIELPHSRRMFFAFARELVFYRRAVAAFLDEKPAKLIAVNDNSIYVRYLFNEANKRGFGTAVLQWALTYPGQKDRPVEKRSSFNRAAYHFKKFFSSKAKTFLLKIIFGAGFIHEKDVLGRGPSKSFGVINEQAFAFFKSCGVPAEKMTVVGYVDFELALRTKKELDADEGKKKRTMASLSIDPSKKRIVIFTSSYNSSVVKVFDDLGQYRFYEDIVTRIRKFCSANEYQILLKIHPIEKKALYAPLEKYGVVVFDKFANNFELVYFSDLYIADSTTANFIPEIMGKDAIFIDFYGLPLIEASRKYLGVKKFIRNPDEFESLLGLWKQGKLEKQYETSDLLVENSLERIVRWVG